MKFPKHISMTLTHNEHKSYYETVQELIEDRPELYGNWVSREDKARAIESNEIWHLQWYPDTPIGFYTLCASSLDVLLEFLSADPLRDTSSCDKGDS